MKKTLLLLFALLTGVSGAWADVLPTAAVGSWMYDSSDPFLTLKSSDDATITTDGDGNIIIHASNLCTVRSIGGTNRTLAAVAMVVDMPDEAPGAFADFFCLKTASNYTGAIGLGVTTDKKLKGTWGPTDGNNHAYGPTTTNAVTGEHTIVILCNNSGTTIYVDDASTSVNTSGLKCATQWTELLIKSAYKEYVKKVFVFNEDQAANISSIFSELAAFNLVEVEDEETKAVSDNSSAYFNVATGGTLTVDVADYDLNKIFGGGDIVIDANTSFTGGKYTLVTGKLTINEGKTLTIGSGDGQTNSIASFTSIDLAGTIVHNNSVATLNNVTVPADKTGKIFAYDMGSTDDGFKLAGTTTLNGNLTVCNKYNFQMKVDNLAGSGTWLICGTTSNAFNAEGTASNEKAIINVAAATTFTGTINLNNVPTDSHPGTNTSQVTVQGNLVGCTLKKTTGDYFYYSGNNLNGTTLDGVVLNSTTARITTSNTVNIKNLAGCNLPNPSGNYGYVFIGSGGTINLYGTCDFTKKADGTTALSSNLGYGSSANIVVKEDATVTVGVAYNTNSSNDNASITVESGATLNTIGWSHADDVLYATNLTNNGTINLSTGGLSGNNGISKVHTTFSGSGTINIAEGTNLQVSSVPNTMTLTGAGDVVLTSFPTSTAPTLSSWTGSVEFPANATAANITGIFNAWGNENSTIKLNNITGYFSPTSDPVIPTLNILENKTLTINNGFSDYPTVLSKLTGKGNLNISWDSSRDPFKLTIQKLFDFDGTLETAKAPINVTKLVLATEPAGDALLLKTSATGVTLSDIYVGEDDITAVCSKKVKTVADVTGYYVTNKQDAVDAIAPYISFIGSSVGKYTVTLVSTPYTNASELETVISGWATLSDCVEPIITINQPTSAFYRIKSGSKYLQDARKSDSATQRTLTDAVGANESAETIFYLNGNTLVGYKTGFGFGYSVCQTRDTEHLNTQRFTESAEMGKYTIQSQKGTYASADWNEGYWGIDDSDLSRKADAASGACWTIETVTSLPITLNAAGDGNYYATLYLPCDVTISGANAYTLSISGAWAVPTAVPDNKIPAGTPVLLKGTSETATATINTGSSFGDAIDCALTGTYAAIDISSTKGSDYYLGRYRDSDSDPYVVGFYHWDQNVLSGFRAYLTAATVNGTLVKGFAINWAGETGVESIEHSPLTIDHEAGAMFDLSGRRVSKAQKGLYIQNGKKVMVK